MRGVSGRGRRAAGRGRSVGLSGRGGRGTRGRGGARGRGRGGAPVSKEQLDSDLDTYMSKTKAHLDAELDAYMASID